MDCIQFRVESGILRTIKNVGDLVTAYYQKRWKEERKIDGIIKQVEYSEPYVRFKCEMSYEKKSEYQQVMTGHRAETGTIILTTSEDLDFKVDGVVKLHSMDNQDIIITTADRVPVRNTLGNMRNQKQQYEWNVTLT